MDSLIQFKVFNVICTVRKQGSLHNEILPFAVHRGTSTQEIYTSEIYIIQSKKKKLQQNKTVQI